MKEEDDLESATERNSKALLDQLRRATVRLVKFKPHEKLPTGTASGFVVQREGRDFVITAGHAIASGRWWLELDAQRNGELAGILVPFASSWVLQAKVPVCGQAKKVDFAWAEVDLERLRADAAEDPELVRGSVELIAYGGPLSESPNSEEPYAFCVLNQPKAGRLKSGDYWLERHPASEIGMEFCGEHPTDSTYVFKLARQHQGHEYYRGTSGAPIADPTGKIVSVVLGGNSATNEIYGLKLADYAGLIGKVSPTR